MIRRPPPIDERFVARPTDVGWHEVATTLYIGKAQYVTLHDPDAPNAHLYPWPNELGDARVGALVYTKNGTIMSVLADGEE